MIGASLYRPPQQGNLFGPGQAGETLATQTLEQAPRNPLPSAGGAIAQLGERLLCKQEVAGSIPAGSTAREMPAKPWSRSPAARSSAGRQRPRCSRFTGRAWASVQLDRCAARPSARGPLSPLRKTDRSTARAPFRRVSRGLRTTAVRALNTSRWNRHLRRDSGDTAPLSVASSRRIDCRASGSARSPRRTASRAPGLSGTSPGRRPSRSPMGV
jgi:hypothetical protein